MPQTLRESFPRIRRISHTEFELDGLKYFTSQFVGRTTPEVLCMIKPDVYLETYVDAMGDRAPANIVEFGVYQGGSTMLFASLFGPDKLVAIDICEPVIAFDGIRAASPIAHKLSVHYNTSQDDEATLNAIFDAQFAGPVDLVIDDASHFYELTKRTFEITFPRLCPGGVYVIEDWQWAHTPGWTLWQDKPSMMNLITQLIMVSVARPDLIARVDLHPCGLAFIHKGAQAPVGETLDIDGACLTRGRPFVLL